MTDPESTPDDVFDVDRIRRLVELMKEHDLREIDLRQAAQRIRLCRGTEPVGFPLAAPAPPPGLPSPPSAPATPAATPPSASEGPHITYIKSPMVGTYYSRPNPKAESFVKVGDHVQKDTTVCIIEAMKVFNEIPAEVSGRIVAVLVEDEEPVEFGKPLFKVDTSK